jgi:ATP-dependent exoDNAse (exonuclease V) beta subunit
MANAHHNKVIRASAGTGKTHELSSRYLSLLNTGQPVDRILATTFTRKAAGEIFDRIVERLAHAATHPKALAQLVGDLQDPTLSAARCRCLLSQFTKHLHRVRVGTLDSFFAELARSLSLEIELPPNWEIIDDANEFMIQQQAVQTLLERHGQQTAVELVHLLHKGEARRSVARLLAETVQEAYAIYQETTGRGGSAWIWIERPRTLPDTELIEASNRFAAQMPTSQFVQAVHKATECVRAGEWEEFLTLTLVQRMFEGKPFNRRAIPQTLAQAIEPLASHARAILIRRIAAQTEGAFQLLKAFDEQYRAAKADRKGACFADIPYALADAKHGVAHSAVAFRLDGRIDHLLLDEFQDTSVAQWNIIRQTAHDVVAPGQGGRSFFCVGDVKQAIYGWRGGVPAILGGIQRELVHVVEEPRWLNRRSAQPIIDTINHIFTRVTRHPDLGPFRDAVQVWCREFPVHTTIHESLSGYACLQTAPAARHNESEKITLKCAADVVAALWQRYGEREIGVLVPTNDAVASFIQLLRDRQIPASEEGGTPLTDSAAVRIIISALRVADHPGHTAALFHLAHSPLGPALGVTPANWHDVGMRTQISRNIRERLLQDGYGTSIDNWAELVRPSCSPRERNRLEQLVEQAYAYQPRATLRSEDFVRLVQRRRVMDPSSALVRVMTIHQAKGLEFESVVLTGLGQPLVRTDTFVFERDRETHEPRRVCRHVGAGHQLYLPQSIQQVFSSDLAWRVQDALSTLYVALTRAKRELRMIVAAPSKNAGPGKSMAGLLLAALNCGRTAGPNQTLYQQGDENWYLEQQGTEPVGTSVRTRAAQPRIRLASSAAADTAQRETVSPSQLAGGDLVRLGTLFSQERTEALHYGTLVHAWLESLIWLDAAGPAPTNLRQIAVSLGFGPAEIAAAIDRFRGMLRNPNLRRVLDRETYEAELLEWYRQLALDPSSMELKMEVRNETDIAAEDGSQILAGVIDRLVLLRENSKIVAADILDYKTDAPSAGQSRFASDLAANYRRQIEAYRRAVGSMCRLDQPRIRARLLFLEADELIEL